MSSSSERLPIAILVSGAGTNLQAILDTIHRHELAATVRLVISNNPTAPALARARAAGVASLVLAKPTGAALVAALQDAGVSLVCLAGYMNILPPEAVQAFPHRIMNIHPALLPAFPGLHAVRQTLAHGVRMTGCTIHFVDTGIDTGPIILQEAVPIAANETEASLTEKLHRVEHRLYPQAIQLFADGKLQIVGRKVLIHDRSLW